MLCFSFVLLMWAVLFVPVVALAISAPSSGSFAYDVYDVTINKMLKGPVGFVAGAAGIVIGVAQLFGGRVLSGVMPILGGALLIKADSIVETLGITF
ncbi:MAG: hypothetical protein ACPLSN_08000 [Dictyoglomus turgidum]